MALPRLEVSVVVTSWSADSALRMTTRARAVTAEADVLTRRRSFKPTPDASGVVCGAAQLGQAAGQQAGDVHLADAEAAGDLGLGEALEEPKMEDDLLSSRKLGDQWRQGDAMFDAGEKGIVLAELAGQALILLVARGTRGVEGREAIRAARFHRLEHLFLRRPGPLGDLTDRRRAAEVLGERAHHLPEPEVELLHASGNAHCPALVAEMALELADDRRGRV